MARVGVTGHQALNNRLRDQGATHTPDEAWAWVERSFNDLLTADAVVVCSLAAGADQRLAGIAVANGLRVEVVVPSAGYETTFGDPGDRREYGRLLAQADEVSTLDFPEPCEEAFYAAGKAVVDRSDLVVAVWDGKDAAGLGGTGDIVRHAREQGKDVVQLDPIRLEVCRRFEEEE